MFPSFETEIAGCDLMSPYLAKHLRNIPKLTGCPIKQSSAQTHAENYPPSKIIDKLFHKVLTRKGQLFRFKKFIVSGDTAVLGNRGGTKLAPNVAVIINRICLRFVESTYDGHEHICNTLLRHPNSD